MDWQERQGLHQKILREHTLVAAHLAALAVELRYVPSLEPEVIEELLVVAHGEERRIPAARREPFRRLHERAPDALSLRIGAHCERAKLGKTRRVFVEMHAAEKV